MNVCLGENVRFPVLSVKSELCIGADCSPRSRTLLPIVIGGPDFRYLDRDWRRIENISSANLGELRDTDEAIGGYGRTSLLEGYVGCGNCCNTGAYVAEPGDGRQCFLHKKHICATRITTESTMGW